MNIINMTGKVVRLGGFHWVATLAASNAVITFVKKEIMAEDVPVSWVGEEKIYIGSSKIEISLFAEDDMIDKTKEFMADETYFIVESDVRRSNPEIPGLAEIYDDGENLGLLVNV